MDEKILTIVVPCYNSQDYMKRCVKSLLSEREGIEIIIVDDGSTDNTAAIADAYEKKYPGIIRAIHQENGGHGAALNTANLSHLCGVLSIGAALFIPFVMPAVFGGTAIVLALPSRGIGDTLSQTARRGILLGAAGIGIHAFIIGSLFVSSLRMVRNESYHEQLNQTSLQLNGQTFDDTVRSLDEALGTNLSDLLGVPGATE